MGAPVTFIRLAGCNLKCDFCDTNHEVHELLMVIEIIKRVKAIGLNRVVITGGEPTIHIDALNDLINELVLDIDEDYIVMLETNGTSTRLIANLSVLCISPKLDQFEYTDEHLETWQALSLHTPHTYFKFPVHPTDESIGKVEAFVDRIVRHDIYSTDIFPLVYIMPILDGEINLANYARTLNILASSKFAITLQLHKVIGVE